MSALGQPQRRPNLGAMPGDWVREAACRDTSWPDAWFATDKQSGEMAYAISVCRECPVRKRCLDFALDLGPSEAQGIWGSTTDHDRKQMWRARGTR